jgi:hypothetical protein
MLGEELVVPLPVRMSSPPKMFGCDVERSPPGPSVSNPPKMLGPGRGASLGALAVLPPEDVRAARDLTRDRHREGEHTEHPHDDGK